jgi:hypothetical protein
MNTYLFTPFARALVNSRAWRPRQTHPELPSKYDGSFGDAQIRVARLAPVRVVISKGYAGVPGLLLDTASSNHLLIAGGGTPGSIDELTLHLTRHAAATIACTLRPERGRPPSTRVIIDTCFQGP